MGTVQYNEEGVLMSIKEICALMTNTTEGNNAYNQLVRLAQVWVILKGSFNYYLLCVGLS